MEIASAQPPSPHDASTSTSSVVGSISSSPSSPAFAAKEESACSSSVSLTAAVVKYEGEVEEEEEDVCRICRNSRDEKNPLRYPCACSGTIKFVHQDCLLQWLNHSKASRCEVCKRAFSFSPVFAENAPARLPFWEFAYGMALKAYHELQSILRLSFFLFVWLFIIPFCTFWTWRFSFVRSFGEAHILFLSRISTTYILTDCLLGFLLSGGIVLILLLVAMLLWGWFKNLQEAGEDVDREYEGDRIGGRAARQPLGQANRNLPGNGNAEDANGAHGVDGADQNIRRNIAVLAGMQVHIFIPVETAFVVLAINMVFLGVQVFVPFQLGRIVLYHVKWLFSSTGGSVLSVIMPLADVALSVKNIILKIMLAAEVNLTSNGQESTHIVQVAETFLMNSTGTSELTSNISIPLSRDLMKEASIGTLHLSNLTTLFVGHMDFLSLIIFYAGTVSLIRYTRGEHLAMRRFRGVISLVSSLILAATRHLMTVIKVTFLLVIELGVIPLICGWWLDACTLALFGKSFTHRRQFLSVSPSASSLVHWAVGFMYLLQIGIFFSLLQRVLSNGGLYFGQNPDVPNYNFVPGLIDDPVHTHIFSNVLSVAVYGSLIVMLVHLPVRLAVRMAPSIFPLDISISDPFTEIPIVVLLLQICIPVAIEHFELRTTIDSFLRYWLIVVDWGLRMIEFILPTPEKNGERGGQDRLQGVEFHGQDQGIVVLEAATDPSGGISTSESNALEEFDGGGINVALAESVVVLHTVFFLLVGWITLLIFNTALIVMPISLGRALFSVIPSLPISHGIKCNDLYAFIIGCYTICTAIAGARCTFDYIRTKRAKVLFNQIWKWSGIVIKCSVLVPIWIFIIPVLIGLLFELLLLVPLRVPVDESPVFLLYQDWALGLILLKIWKKLVMVNMMPLSDEDWRIKFTRVKEDGFSNLKGHWILREILFPIMMNLLTTLCVPYVFARGVFPLFGFSLVVNSAVYRFAWLGCLCLGILCICAKRFHVWFTNLHNSIWHDRYLVGREVHNYYGEREKEKQMMA